MPAHRSLSALSRILPSSPKLKVSHYAPISAAYFCTHIDVNQPMLVRDYIHSALYDPGHGYFSKRSASVGVLDSSIKFNNLQGRKAYLQHLNKIYKQSQISWFTPVELFKPWYAHGIAEAILRTANLSVPLKIYEIGGGSGTCAKGIMDYLMLNAPPRVYNNMTYISVEISPSLAEKQKETVGQVQSHKSRFTVECRDAADRNGWGNVQQEPCWVIMLEVLDNLPHDLIYAENQASPWEEVWVEKQLDRAIPSESYRPLQDRLIKLCIEILAEDINGPVNGVASAARSIFSKIFPKPRRCWLPTGCLKLMEALHSALPKMSLIASDFSYLPDVRIPGVRAPLVSAKTDCTAFVVWYMKVVYTLEACLLAGTWEDLNLSDPVIFTFQKSFATDWLSGMIDGCSIDYDSYLDAKGDADIFFPTDFWLLERFDHYCSGWLETCQNNPSKEKKKRRTFTLDTSAFMEQFGLPSKTRTKDGYNPLLDDFKNTKFYLSVPTYNIK